MLLDEWKHKVNHKIIKRFTTEEITDFESELID